MRWLGRSQPHGTVRLLQTPSGDPVMIIKPPIGGTWVGPGLSGGQAPGIMCQPLNLRILGLSTSPRCPAPEEGPRAPTSWGRDPLEDAFP